MPSRTLFKRPEDHIAQAKQVLLKHDKYKTTITLVESRIDEFRAELTNNAADKKQVEEQFRQFASTLHLCVSRREHTASFIDKYINNPQYYPVGVVEKRLPDPWEQKLFSRMFKLSLLCFATSIPLFFVNPVAGGLVLLGALMLFIPSVLYFLSPTRLNVDVKKEDDKMIFEAVKMTMSAPIEAETPKQPKNTLYPDLATP